MMLKNFSILLCSLSFLLAGFCWGDSAEELSLKEEKRQQRTLLFADSVSYDQKEEVITASGNVEVSRGSASLYADRVFYNQKADRIIATGNVRLLDGQKNITFTERFEISGDFKEGIAEAIRGIMADDALYAANRVKRTKGTHNQFDQVVYTPCKVCRKEHKKPPTWLIKSRHMVFDEETGYVTHGDSTLEILGIPVLYTPYLSHPGPTIKRKSGFLTPVFGGSDNLGAIVGLPYFWAIDESKDMTITPVYTRDSPLLMLAYRQAFCSGLWEIEGSLTKSPYKKKTDDALPETYKLRGHLKTKGRFKIRGNWFAGFDVKRALDGTYIKKYRFLGLEEDSFLTSRLYTESFWDRNYALVEAINYQALRQEDQASSIPFVLPSAELHILSKPTYWNGSLFMDTSVLNLQRRKGHNVKRFSFEGGWKSRYVTSFGALADFGLQGRWDFYDVSGFKLPNNTFHSGRHTRFMPKAYATLKYPLYANFDSGRFILEPLAGVVLAGNHKNSIYIPNEDSSLFELSDANLFSPRRFSGLDVMDEWSRVNYGLKFSFFSKDFGNSELFAGQSYSFSKIPSSYNSAGLKNDYSDYVLRALYNYKDWVELNSRLLLNKKDFNTQRNESSITVGQPILRGNVSYIRFPKVKTPTVFVEQISYGLLSKFTKDWLLEGKVVRALGVGGGNLSHGAVLTYENDCFLFSTSLEKTFYKDRDYKPGTTIMFKLSFKNLGSVQWNKEKALAGTQ